MREELLQKQKELLDLQKKKLELEMIQQQSRLTERLEPLIKSELQKVSFIYFFKLILSMVSAAFF